MEKDPTIVLKLYEGNWHDKEKQAKGDPTLLVLLEPGFHVWFNSWYLTLQKLKEKDIPLIVTGFGMWNRNESVKGNEFLPIGNHRDCTDSYLQTFILTEMGFEIVHGPTRNPFGLLQLSKHSPSSKGIHPNLLTPKCVHGLILVAKPLKKGKPARNDQLYKKILLLRLEHDIKREESYIGIWKDSENTARNYRKMYDGVNAGAQQLKYYNVELELPELEQIYARKT